jgi:sulfide:quinone oxidoreductase
MKKVVILGAGFGGLELSTQLAERLAGQVEVTLIDERDAFVVGFAKIEVLFGRATPEQVRNPYRALKAPGVEFKQERVLSLDPAAKTVSTSRGTYQADLLVVALGAEVDASATPGLEQGGHEFYTLEGAQKLAAALPKVRRGPILIGILGMPYKCPPAPFEVALQLHDWLVRAGKRGESSIRVLSPAPVPLPVSPQGSEKLLELMRERGIFFTPGALVTELEPAKKMAVLKTGERFAYELFMAVPVHRVPLPVEKSPLAPKGWVQVNAETLETAFEGVYALGDVTSIPVGQGAVPKAGAFADRAARSVADDIVHKVTGQGPRGRFDGVGACYLEFGEGNVAKIEADYFSGPSPQVNFVGPSLEFKPHKTAFAEDRLARWFKK